MTEIPTTMRAVVLTSHGDLDRLEYREDWPTPEPGPEQALVKIHACGLNNTDVNTRTGWYSKGVTGNTTGEALDSADDDDSAWGGAPLSFPMIQGADAVGTVVAVGDAGDQALQEAIGRKTVSVVADVVGGDYFSTLIDVLERGGRYTCSGAIAGPIVDLDLRTLYLQDLTFTGATIVPHGTFGDLVGYIERGEVRPLLAATYPLEKLADAQAEFIRKRHVGNIVVVT